MVNAYNIVYINRVMFVFNPARGQLSMKIIFSLSSRSNNLYVLALNVVVTIGVVNYKPKFTLGTGFPLPNVRSNSHWELSRKRSEGIHAGHFADKLTSRA